MPAFPVLREGREFFEQTGIDPPIRLVFKVISNLVQVHHGWIIHVFVRHAWPCDSDTKSVGTCKKRAKPFQPKFSDAFRRLKMENRRDQVNLPAIILIGLTWKPQQNIPGYMDVIVAAPFEALD